MENTIKLLEELRDIVKVDERNIAYVFNSLQRIITEAKGASHQSPKSAEEWIKESRYSSLINMSMNGHSLAYVLEQFAQSQNQGMSREELDAGWESLENAGLDTPLRSADFATSHDVKSAEEWLKINTSPHAKMDTTTTVSLPLIDIIHMLEDYHQFASQQSDEWVSVKCTDCHKITKVLKNENETHFCSYCTHPIWRELPQPPK